LCTYLARKKANGALPFRFILNHSVATATNVYLLLYPRPWLRSLLARDPGMLRRVWELLNSLSPSTLLGEGRVYGGGLHKLEPSELANVSLDEVVNDMPAPPEPASVQHRLFS
jgi:hypothetical protein